MRVGITDFAQDALGDIVFVQLPERATTVTAGEPLRRGRVDQERVARSTPRSPARWRPATTQLDDTPELINTDPYGEGWLVEIEPADPTALERSARRRRVRAS